MTPWPGEKGFGEKTYPDVLEFLNRGLRQGRRQGGAGHPSQLVVLPGDQKQLIPDGDNNPQLSAVVRVDGVQVASWEESDEAHQVARRWPPPGLDGLAMPSRLEIGRDPATRLRMLPPSARWRLGTKTG